MHQLCRKSKRERLESAFDEPLAGFAQGYKHRSNIGRVKGFFRLDNNAKGWREVTTELLSILIDLFVGDSMSASKETIFMARRSENSFDEKFTCLGASSAANRSRIRFSSCVRAKRFRFVRGGARNLSTLTPQSKHFFNRQALQFWRVSTRIERWPWYWQTTVF